MRELDNNPEVAKWQLKFFDAIDKAKPGLHKLDKSAFRSDVEGIARDTIAALEEQLAIWKKIVEDNPKP